MLLFRIIFLYSFLFFPDYPITNRTLTTIEIYTYFKQALTICRIWNQISLFINLPDSFFGRTIILQFKNKHGIRHIHHGISPAYRTVLLYPHVGTHQVEDKIEHRLEIPFVLITQAVGDTGKIGLQAHHRSLNISIIELFQEITYQTVVIQRYWRKIVGRKTLEHPRLNLLVRIFQRIAMQYRIILLDGEVTALIEQRKCRGHQFGRNIKVIYIT